MPEDRFEQLLMLLKEIRDGLAARGGDVSPSITVEDMSKGDPKITTKSYGGAPLTYRQVDDALEAHGYAHRRAAEMAMKQWQDTVDNLVAGRA